MSKDSKDSEITAAELSYINQVSNMFSVLGIDNITEEKIAEGLEARCVEQINELTADTAPKSELNNKPRSSEKLRYLQSKISLYRDVQEGLAIQVKELENLIERLQESEDFEQVAEEVGQLQKLKTSLGLTQKKLAAYVKLARDYEKLRAKELKILQDKIRIAKLMKDKKKKQAKLKQQIANAKKVDVLARFFLPGKFFEEFKQTQQQDMQKTAGEIAKVSQEINVIAKDLPQPKQETLQPRPAAKQPEGKLAEATKSTQNKKEQKSLPQAQPVKNNAALKIPTKAPDVFARVEVKGVPTPATTPSSARQKLEQERNKKFEKDRAEALVLPKNPSK